MQNYVISSCHIFCEVFNGKRIIRTTKARIFFLPWRFSCQIWIKRSSSKSSSSCSLLSYVQGFEKISWLFTNRYLTSSYLCQLSNGNSHDRACDDINLIYSLGEKNGMKNHIWGYSYSKNKVRFEGFWCWNI